MIIDGFYCWDDIFNFFICFIEGIEVNGFFKFYENNFFYCLLIVRGEFFLCENFFFEWFN